MGSNTGPEIRRELVDRLHHATVEAEAAFWNKLKEMFPEASRGDMPPSICTALWKALDGVTRAWAIENVPGMVEALANEHADREETAERYDERDQT